MDRKGSTLTMRPDSPLGWLRFFLFVLLCAFAAWLTVRLVLALLAPSSTWEPVLIAETAPTDTPQSVSYDFSYNPFPAGDVSATVTTPVDTGDDAPETTLNLTLNGLRAGLNGTAFIRTPDGQEDNYYVGDTIMPNVILRGVFPTHVLIDVNGQTQRLTTEEAKAAARSGEARPSRTSGLRTLGRVDASQLLSQIQLIPSFDRNMRRNGLAISTRNASVDLSDFGLQTGDIITRFAGQSTISGLPDIVAIRQAATSGRPVAIDLIRDGLPFPLEDASFDRGVWMLSIDGPVPTGPVRPILPGQGILVDRSDSGTASSGRDDADQSTERPSAGSDAPSSGASSAPRPAGPIKPVTGTPDAIDQYYKFVGAYFDSLTKNSAQRSLKPGGGVNPGMQQPNAEAATELLVITRNPNRNLRDLSRSDATRR
ncbi:MAG: type II secretion system protein N, partial [Pseudomonadota bacterium]